MPRYRLGQRVSDRTTPQILTIANVDGLVDAVRSAADTGMPLVDYGLAHHGLGHAPPAEHTAISQQSDQPIIEHYTGDLTVRAAAGGTIAALNKQLESTKQFVPVDADDDLTLGEVMHHNAYGPLRIAFGSVRDLTLGLSYIDHQGRQITVGGRTVKNVAGYDVSRFMVGSLGELGIIYEANLRTYAIPEHVTQIDLRIDNPTELDQQITILLLSDATPTHFAYSRRFDHQTGRHDAAWIGHLAYFGGHTGCMVQVRSLETLLETCNGLHIDGCGDHTFAQDQIERVARRTWRRTVPALVKIIVPPATTGQVANALAQFADNDTELHIDAMPVHGCIFVGGELDHAAATRLDAHINNTIKLLGGMRAWYMRPANSVSSDDMENNIEPFAPVQPEWSILNKLKQTMDPKKIFNPGRFLR